MRDNYNKQIVAFYELNVKQNDVDFFITQAKKCGSEILELGIGTGRIGVELAKKGYSVVGVDSSDLMLSELKKRIKQFKLKNLHIIKGDLIKINLKKQFDLIIMPFRVYQQIHYQENQIKALQNVYKHLSDKGIFIFNVFNPDFVILAGDHGKEVIDYKDKYITRTHFNWKHDKQNQIIYTKIKIYKNSKVVASHNLMVSYFFQKELKFLLESCKFKVIELRSNYNSKIFKDNQELIFICKKGV